MILTPVNIQFFCKCPLLANSVVPLPYPSFYACKTASNINILCLAFSYLVNRIQILLLKAVMTIKNKIYKIHLESCLKTRPGKRKE
jgi:hypothetical protein